jgi:hypothetical protein
MLEGCWKHLKLPQSPVGRVNMRPSVIASASCGEMVWATRRYAFRQASPRADRGPAFELRPKLIRCAATLFELASSRRAVTHHVAALSWCRKT